VPFIIQLGLLATPAIYYDLNNIPERLQRYMWLVHINPINACVAAFRAAILNQPINFAAWGTSAAVMTGVLLIGLVYFKQTERKFADII